MGLTVIIPSRTASNLIPCVEAVRRHEPAAEILVIDDGVDANALTGKGWAACTFISGVKPFIYARNCNLGISMASRDDVVLLNDDAILMTRQGFSLLQKAAQARPQYGLIAATCNNVGNPNQQPGGMGLSKYPRLLISTLANHRLSLTVAALRADPRMICFVAVLIPRRTVDTVGLLDERFVAYGYEDDDYCLRVRRAGLKIGIHDACHVDHNSLRSTFRDDPRSPVDLDPGRRLFIEKWGAHPL